MAASRKMIAFAVSIARQALNTVPPGHRATLDRHQPIDYAKL